MVWDARKIIAIYGDVEFWGEEQFWEGRQGVFCWTLWVKYLVEMGYKAFGLWISSQEELSAEDTN